MYAPLPRHGEKMHIFFVVNILFYERMKTPLLNMKIF